MLGEECRAASGEGSHYELESYRTAIAQSPAVRKWHTVQADPKGSAVFCGKELEGG